MQKTITPQLGQSIDVTNAGSFEHCHGAFERDVQGTENLATVLGLEENNDDLDFRVGVNTALSQSAFWKCISLICNTVAKVPLLTYRVTLDGGREIDKLHPAYRLLRRRANKLQISFDWKRQMMMHALIWGNHFSLIRRNQGGFPTAIEPIDPRYVMIGHVNGRFLYGVPDMKNNGGPMRFVKPENMFHVKGMGFDGIRGYPILDLMKPTIAQSEARRRFTTRYFGKGANPSGVVSIPYGMDDTQLERFRKGLQEKTEGLRNSSKLLLLEEDIKFIPITHTPVDAQVDEGAQMSEGEIANFFCLSKATVGVKGFTAFRSLESQVQSDIDNAFDPWMSQIEELCFDRLNSFTQRRDETHEFAFKLEDIKRVDQKTRVETEASRVNNGIITLNEARQDNHRPTINRPEADTPRIPKNMTHLGDEQNEQQNEQQNATGDDDIEATTEGVRRVVRSFAGFANRARTKASTLAEFVDNGHTEHRERFVQDVSIFMRPVERRSGKSELAEALAVSLLDETISVVNKLLDVSDSDILIAAQFAKLVEPDFIEAKLRKLIP